MAEENPVTQRRVLRGQHAHTLERQVTKAVSCRYWLFLPRRYGRTAERWPLILFLHGAGERGRDLRLVKKHGLPKLVQKQKDFPFLVVSPQCPRDEWWSNDTLCALLDEVIETYAVDPDRVYLTGLSMGGYGTWSLATAHPERFAAIAPICGGGNPLLAPRLQHVPVWAFHGAKDQVVLPKETERMVKALRRCGADEIQLTVYPHAEHDSWAETYANPALYEWFLQHRRHQAPE